MYKEAFPANSINAGAPMQSEVGKIQAQFDAAESVYNRVLELARQLVGEQPEDPSSVAQKSGGTLGDLAYRAECLTDYASKASEEIDRIYRATSF